MGNILCRSVVVIAIPNTHTQDAPTDSLSLMVKTTCCKRRSAPFLAAFGGSYAPAGTNVVRGLSVVPGRITSIYV